MISCSEEEKLQKLPVTKSINLESKGVVSTFDFEVKEHWVYYFGLHFMFLRGDERALKSIMLMPVKLTIIKKGSQNPIIYQKKYMVSIFQSWGGDRFPAEIGHCDLVPGEYTAILENLDHPEKYNAMPASFTIGMIPKWKFSFDAKNIDKSKTCPQ